MMLRVAILLAVALIISNLLLRDSSQPALRFSPPEMVFESVPVHGIAPLSIVVTNTSQEDITLLGSTSGCFRNVCIWLETSLPLRIPAGSQRTLEFEFSPATVEDHDSATIQLFVDRPDPDHYEVRLQWSSVESSADGTALSQRG